MLRLTLQTALVLIFLGSVIPSQAFQIVNNYTASPLIVCNKGTVPVEVVVAAKRDDMTRTSIIDAMRGAGKYYWNLVGTIIAPQACKSVDQKGDPAYIAFGFTDSKGVWGSGKIPDVPDIGSVGRPAPG